MSLVLPIPSGTNSSLLENDLGRGFSIDENGGNAIKNTVFICEKEYLFLSFVKKSIYYYRLWKEYLFLSFSQFSFFFY